MAVMDMGGNTEFLGTAPGQAQAYPPGFYIGSSSAIIPSTTHTQAAATPILTQQVTCNPAVAADGVILPPAVAGVEVVVRNSAAATAMQVYATGTDTIGVTAGSTGVVHAAATTTIYYCFVTGNWQTK